MTCETCGAAVSLESSEGGTKRGQFTEQYNCANGHSGMVSGEAGEPADAWSRTGAVFNAY